MNEKEGGGISSGRQTKKVYFQWLRMDCEFFYGSEESDFKIL